MAHCVGQQPIELDIELGHASSPSGVLGPSIAKF